MHLTEEHSRKLRVLVAEDDVQIGPLLKDLLAGHDMVVIGPMRSVAEAIAAVRMDAIDCALLDVRLHGGEAGPVAEELLRRAVPYIVMTGGGRAPLPAALTTAPRLTKPFRTDELISLIAVTCSDRD